MDAGICRTSTGQICKLGQKRGGLCSRHGGSPSPKSSPERRALNDFTKLDCSVLLKIAEYLDPEDYISMSQLSYEIDMCLSERRYKGKKEKAELKMVQRNILAKESKAVRWEGSSIRYIKNPTKTAQLAAVKQNGLAIQYIETPSEEMKLAAVKQNGLAIQYIENQTEKLQIEAVKNNAESLKYILNPSESLKWSAVALMPHVIRDIENPSENLQLAAVKLDPNVLSMIKNPTNKVLAYVVKADFHKFFTWEVFHPQSDLSEEIQLEMIKQNPDYFTSWVKRRGVELSDKVSKELAKRKKHFYFF